MKEPSFEKSRRGKKNERGSGEGNVVEAVASCAVDTVAEEGECERIKNNRFVLACSHQLFSFSPPNGSYGWGVEMVLLLHVFWNLSTCILSKISRRCLGQCGGERWGVTYGACEFCF